MKKILFIWYSYSWKSLKILVKKPGRRKHKHDNESGGVISILYHIWINANYLYTECTSYPESNPIIVIHDNEIIQR